jgi:hypothetical protein
MSVRARTVPVVAVVIATLAVPGCGASSCTASSGETQPNPRPQVA